MNPSLFLLLALAVSVVGCIVLVTRSRRSSTPDASIDEFNAKLRALSGDPVGRRGRGERRGS